MNAFDSFDEGIKEAKPAKPPEKPISAAPKKGAFDSFDEGVDEAELTKQSHAREEAVIAPALAKGALPPAEKQHAPPVAAPTGKQGAPAQPKPAAQPPAAVQPPVQPQNIPAAAAPAPQQGLKLDTELKSTPAEKPKEPPHPADSAATKVIGQISDIAKRAGKAGASAVDTVYNIIPGTLQWIAYAVARGAQQTPEEAQATASKAFGWMNDPIGKASGITGDKAYENEATRNAMDFISNNMGKGAAWISEQTGMPKADVENALNTLLMAAPGLPKAAKTVAEQARKAGKAEAKPKAAERIEPKMGEGPKVDYALPDEFGVKVDATKDVGGRPEPKLGALTAAIPDEGFKVDVNKPLPEKGAKSPYEGEVMMGAGITPTALEKLPEAIKDNRVVDSVNKIFRPYSRGAIAEEQKGVLRANAAQMARQQEVAATRLERFRKTIGGLGEKERYAVIDAIERGQKQRTPELQAAADDMRALLDERKNEVQKLGTGALQTWIEDYFPHIWKDQKKAAAALSEIQKAAGGKKPLQGKGAFLKERVIPTTADGVKYGLEPVTTNPLDLTLLKLREMDRFIFGTRVMQEMKQRGLAQFVKFGDKPPGEGWVKINDKAARVLQWSEAERGFVARGDYWAPEQAGTLINNYLSPGMRGNAAYDLIRGTGNLMNMTQLGFSAFHLGFTTLDASVSKTALGIEQVSRGDVLRGGANVAKGVLLSEAVANVWRGDKLLKAYRNPGTGGPMLEKIVDGLVQGGGRVSMDRFYDISNSGSYYRSWQHGQLLDELKAKGVAKNVAEFFPRFVQTLSAPIMEVLVPRQKLGVFSDLMADELRRNPNMTADQMRTKAGKIWDSVDNRLGEMVYDNLFWNNMIKDLSLISVRSVGWNLGTIREIGGGAIDAAKQAGKAASGKKPEMTHKMAYVAALPIVTGFYGAIYQYMMTGQGPTELKDYFFPKTGRMTPAGDPERIALPTYVKDIAEYYHAPGTTVTNKLHPLMSFAAQLYRNEDFYGAEIRDEDADWMTQAGQLGGAVAGQFEPFSVRGYERQRDEGAPVSKSIQSFFGLNPAPGFITKDETAQHKSDIRKRKDKIIKRHMEEGDSYRSARKKVEREIREAE